MTETKEDIAALVKENIGSEEGRRKLSMLMVAKIRENMAKQRAENLADQALPLCVRLIHPFLGSPPCKDTCPECGYTVKKDSAR